MQHRSGFFLAYLYKNALSSEKFGSNSPSPIQLENLSCDMTEEFIEFLFYGLPSNQSSFQVDVLKVDTLICDIMWQPGNIPFDDKKYLLKKKSIQMRLSDIQES